MDDDLDYHIPKSPNEAETAREADIQELLDAGYEQMDDFVTWEEEALKLPTRITQQDAFNVEALLDYLANQHRKSAEQINEFEMRWFVFSHYIRKAMGDEPTEARVLESLQRFWGWLQSEQRISPPVWLSDVLDDQEFYANRRRAYHALNQQDERQWEMGFRQWSAELEEDLDTRVLWLPRELGDGILWADPMGWREATLYEEANQLWQRERSDLLYSGLDFETVRNQLLGLYLEWIETPQDKLDFECPRDVIAQERLEREEHEEETGEERRVRNPIDGSDGQLF